MGRAKSTLKNDLLGVSPKCRWEAGNLPKGQ
jgi:hypothetical protein